MKPNGVSRSARIWFPASREWRRQFHLAFLARALSLITLGFLLADWAKPQTSIVIYRNEKEAFIGADSKRTLINVTPTGNPTVVTTVIFCKIKQVGDTFIAFAGIGGSSSDNFDAYSIAMSAIRDKPTLREKAESFQSAISQPLMTILERTRPQRDWSRLQDLLNSPVRQLPNVFQAILCRFERGVPSYVRLSWDASVPESGPITLTPDSPFYCPGDCKGDAHFSPIGRREAIDEVRDFIDGRYWKSYGGADGVRFLVTMETAALPAEVGKPIDVLRITKDGACWVPPKGKKDCDDPQIQECKSPPLPKPTTPRRKRG